MDLDDPTDFKNFDLSFECTLEFRVVVFVVFAAFAALDFEFEFELDTDAFAVASTVEGCGDVDDDGRRDGEDDDDDERKSILNGLNLDGDDDAVMIVMSKPRKHSVAVLVRMVTSTVGIQNFRMINGLITLETIDVLDGGY